MARSPWREVTRFPVHDGDTQDSAAAWFVITHWQQRVRWEWVNWADGTLRVGTRVELYRVRQDEAGRYWVAEWLL